MRGLIVGSSDLSDASVGGHDDDGGLVRLKGSVQEREALNVKHMHLIDKENTWHDLRTSLLSPLGNFLIDLLPNFWLDFSNISCEQGHESLRPRIDDINLVKSNSVNDFFPLLQFTLGALDESGLWSLVVEITWPRERFSKLWDLSRSFVDSDDVASHDLLLLDALNHLVTQIIDSLHLRRLESDLACLVAALDGLVDLDFDDFTFDDFGLLSDSYT